MPCTSCKKEKPIINKKYNLCVTCNSLRLHNATPQERQAQSALKYQQKALEKFRSKVKEETDILVPNKVNNWDRKRKPIRQHTNKESGIKSQLSIIKREIELEAVQNNEYYCAGCGKSQIGLDKSHILSVGQFKHLELEKGNIQLMCRTCHITHESGEIQAQLKLHCFISNLIFIYFHNITSYNKFITRIEEYKTFLFDNEKEQVNLILEKIKEGIELAG